MDLQATDRGQRLAVDAGDADFVIEPFACRRQHRADLPVGDAVDHQHRDLGHGGASRLPGADSVADVAAWIKACALSRLVPGCDVVIVFSTVVRAWLDHGRRHPTMRGPPAGPGRSPSWRRRRYAAP